MATATQSGVIGTAQAATAGQVSGASNEVRLLHQDNADFLDILNKLPSEPAKAVQVIWLDGQSLPNVSTLAASATSAATTISVATGEGQFFRANDLVAILDPVAGVSVEVVQVTGITSDDLGVTRSYGDAAAVSAQAAATLVNMGPVIAQGADFDANSLYVQATTAYNYCEIFRTQLELTKTADKIEKYGPDRSLLISKSKEHSRKIEAALFFGQRVQSSNTSSLGGITQYVASGTSVGGALSLTAIYAALDDPMAHGSGDKCFFLGPRAAMGFQVVLGTNYLPVTPGQTVNGIKASAIVNLPWGSFPVVVKREWARQGAGSATGLGGGFGFMVDLGNVKLRPMKGRKLKLLQERQAPGIDLARMEYLSELSLEVSNPAAHYIFRGITT